MSCGRQWRHPGDDLGHFGRLLVFLAEMVDEARSRGDDEDGRQALLMAGACFQAFGEALDRAVPSPGRDRPFQRPSWN